MTGITLKLLSNWRKRLTGHLNIAKKIGYGYGLAISVALLGTSIGLTVGDRSQQKAQEQLQVAELQNSLLNELMIATMTVQMHPQRLVAVLKDSIWFRYETSKFTNDVNQLKKKVAELETFVQENSGQLAGDTQQFEALIQEYTEAIELNTRFTKDLWEQIDPQTLQQSEQLAQARRQIMVALTQDETVRLRLRFDRLSESLIYMRQSAVEQRAQAYTQLEQADAFRLNTIVLSMLLSLLIAILLAIVTSRTIARPIQTLTNVAQRSIRESNFDLQAPVTSHDEIGLLSHSFNQLIHSVNQLLAEQQAANEQLETYNHTLEQKVTERTYELSEKNNHLNQLIEELHRTQTQMVQSEKMSSLGQLVAGVAHEINNPINFIHGNISHVDVYSHDLLKLIDLYQQHYPQPLPALKATIDEIDLDFVVEDLPKILQSMKVGTDRIREIVLSLRNFSRLDEAEFKSVDIHEGIENTLMILYHRLKAKAERPEIQVIREYGQLPPVECYPGQLNQVFMNLLANAIDALEESNQSRSFQDITVHPNIIRIQTHLTSYNHVVVTISDNGLGIPEALQARLFDPFFTTKPVGKGTGLGLSISYQIVVEKHRGKMYCTSQAGQGTTFVLEIPVRQSRWLGNHENDVDETALFT